MKQIFLIPAFVFLTCCRHSEKTEKSLQSQIDSLKQKINSSYRPGLGEFMSNIQIHHAKLWFAGIAGNWDLSDFELKEIYESVDDIQTYCTDRPERELIPMIIPALDSIRQAITNKNIVQFRNSFLILTNTCNRCHLASKHEFNVIRIPETPPFSNQDFQIIRK